MARISNAEKQRLYRQRRDADPARRVQYLTQKRDKYVKDKDAGKRKLISQKKPREQRLQRKQWRKQQQTCRRGKQLIAEMTPPPTPEVQGLQPTRQQRTGRRISAKQRSRVYRENERLRNVIQTKEKEINRYKTRLSRLQRGLSQKNPTQVDDSPRTKTKKLLRHIYHPPTKVKKTLTFHHALIHGLRNRYRETKNQREKQNIKRLLTNKIIRKYRVLTLASREIGFIAASGQTDNRVSRAAHELRKSVQDFFLRDDVSRLAAGKKNTLTQKKQKKQRRLLTDSLENLHMKFQSESLLSVSYSFFCKLRPFWVVAPSERDRDTCLCMTHENFQFFVDKLFNVSILNTNDLTTILQTIVCDTTSKDCAYSTCTNCNLTAFPLQRQPDQTILSVAQWERQKQQRKVKDSDTTVESIITVKANVEMTEDAIVDKFQQDIDRLKKHVFNIRRQFTMYQELRRSLEPTECLLHVDFSEDYTCRYSTEIQSVHFGGSHKHACLHTGVLYLSPSADAVAFCTISDSTRHDPSAIWAHLTPVLDWIKAHQPQIATLHFFSDSPSSQYRQKGNFHLMSTLPFELGFKKLTWNFFEASHGKGAPDGVGGSLKRQADRLSRQGHDIPTADVLYRKLKETDSSVHLFYVDGKQVEKADDQLSSVGPLMAVKGTMQIHQVVSLASRSLKTRPVSCFCSKKEGVLDCLCFGLRTVNVLKYAHHPDKQDQQSVSTEGRPEGPIAQTVLEGPVAQTVTEDPVAQTVPEGPAAETVNRNQSHDDGPAVSAAQYTLQSPLHRPEIISTEHENEWCIIEYDGVAYPGVILAVENDDIQIDCMHSVGENRFFWPTHRDKNWYTDEQVISFIPQPSNANRRHVMVDKDIWEAVGRLLC